VSWKLNKKDSTDHCLLAFLYSFHLIRNRKEYYLERYGFVPTFKSALHCGEVIYGEIGETKSEIVFHGDTINTTARMERLCTDLKETLLISEQLMNSFSENTRKHFILSGSVTLRGKNKSMQVFSLIPGTIVSLPIPTSQNDKLPNVKIYDVNKS
jgi:adenylate cyclase